MYQISDYQISGLNIRFILPADWRLVQSAHYESFRTMFLVPDIIIKFRQKDRLYEGSGRLVYEETGERVLRQGDRVFHYLGNHAYAAGCGNDVKGRAVYCRQYSISRKGYYAVDIRRTKREYTEKFLLESAGLPHILADFRRVVLHSSFVAYKGGAILFTAPSGTGKSTQAELWRVCRSGAEIINGDRSILSFDKEHAYAHGIPLCGTSGITKNCTMPVRAIVVLEQGEKNQICRLSQSDAFIRILAECGMPIWSTEDTGTITEIVSGIVAEVPVYLYACRPDSSAVDILEKELGHREESADGIYKQG